MVIKRKSALVIDDDPDFCAIIRAILEAKGMDVIDVASISEAKNYLTSNTPNIILLDMELKDEYGTDFLKERSTNFTWSRIPVIVCSSQSMATVVKAAIKFGADDYLIKPIKQTWLIQRIRKNLIKEDTLIFNFPEDEEIELEVEATSISVSKTSFIARGCVGYDVGAVITAEIPLVENEEPVVSKFRCEDKSRFSNKGPFDTLLSSSAITEADQRRLQLMKAFWRPKDD